MRWIALLAAALIVGAVVLLLLVVPPASAVPASAARASLDQGGPRGDNVQLARSNGHKAR